VEEQHRGDRYAAQALEPGVEERLRHQPRDRARCGLANRSEPVDIDASILRRVPLDSPVRVPPEVFR
jgi:hypothetical protein